MTIARTSPASRDQLDAPTDAHEMIGARKGSGKHWIVEYVPMSKSIRDSFAPASALASITSALGAMTGFVRVARFERRTSNGTVTKRGSVAHVRRGDFVTAVHGDMAAVHSDFARASDRFLKANRPRGLGVERTVESD